ncbi:APC family permease [Pseudonocardia acaciae]|uniref:APC family permease n=1 Tax=Pseudonocardia acaciae TaxID=551276 RepID=UPI000564CCD3|nr:amino acid permease [Pseudonocardia acaciae]
MSDDTAQFGYRQEFRRTVRSFGSFAIAFSTASALTGIVTTYGFLLTTAGPRGTWMWIGSVVGRLAVALIVAQFVARMPLTGFIYQWSSKLANPIVGWGMGWLYFATMPIVIVATDIGLATQAFLPLFDIEPTPLAMTLVVLATLCLQALVAAYSTRLVNAVNGTAVGAEIVALVVLTVALFVAALASGGVRPATLFSAGVVDEGGYWAFAGPFMMAALLGAYTIAGFEGAAELSEETHNPSRTAPRAIIRAVVISGVTGFVFLLALTMAITDVGQVSEAGSPVAFILGQYIGPPAERFVLALVTVAMFSCGLCLMLSASRTSFAMARDRRFPGYRLLRRVPPRLGTPAWATALVWAIAVAVVLTVGQRPERLNDVLSGGTIISVFLYLCTVVVYLAIRRRLPDVPAGGFDLRGWDLPVAAFAGLWCLFELLVLTVPEMFHAGLALSTVFFGTGAAILAWYLLVLPGRFGERQR